MEQKSVYERRLLGKSIHLPQKVNVREFQFKFIHRIVVTEKELHRYGMIAYTAVERKTPLTTHLETANLQLLLKLRSSVGLTKQTTPSLTHPLRKNYLASPQLYIIQLKQENSIIRCYS